MLEDRYTMYQVRTPDSSENIMSAPDLVYILVNAGRKMREESPRPLVLEIWKTVRQKSFETVDKTITSKLIYVLYTRRVGSIEVHPVAETDVHLATIS